MSGIFPLRTCVACGKRMRGPENLCGMCADELGTKPLSMPQVTVDTLFAEMVSDMSTEAIFLEAYGKTEDEVRESFTEVPDAGDRVWTVSGIPEVPDILRGPAPDGAQTALNLEFNAANDLWAEMRDRMAQAGAQVARARNWVTLSLVGLSGFAIGVGVDALLREVIR